MATHKEFGALLDCANDKNAAPVPVPAPSNPQPRPLSITPLRADRNSVATLKRSLQLAGNAVLPAADLERHQEIVNVQRNFHNVMQKTKLFHCQHCRQARMTSNAGQSNENECEACKKQMLDKIMRCRKFAHPNDMDPFYRKWREGINLPPTPTEIEEMCFAPHLLS